MKNEKSQIADDLQQQSYLSVTSELNVNTANPAGVKGFSFSLKIPGVSQISEIFKNGREIVSGIGGIIDSLFTKTKRTNTNTTQLQEGLRALSEEFKKIHDANQKIYDKLESIEKKIITAINDATNLEPHHTIIKRGLYGDPDTQPDRNTFSGALFYLAANEYRPSCIANIIVGFEAYLALYASKTGSRNDKVNRVELLSRVISNADHLMNNLHEFNNIYESEIDILTGQLISYYRIVKKGSQAALLNKQIDVEMNDYYRSITSIDDFDIKAGGIAPYNYICEEQMKVKKQIIELLESGSMYLELAKLVYNYKMYLENEKKGLI